MPRIEVEPGQLGAGAGRQQAVSAQMLEASGRLEAAGLAAADAAGEAALAGAIAGWTATWARSLSALGATVGATAANVGAAGEAYTVTDQTAIAR